MNFRDIIHEIVMTILLLGFLLWVVWFVLDCYKGI